MNDKHLLERAVEALERIAVAIEKQNELAATRSGGTGNGPPPPGHP